MERGGVFVYELNFGNVYGRIGWIFNVEILCGGFDGCENGVENNCICWKI